MAIIVNIILVFFEISIVLLVSYAVINLIPVVFYKLDGLYGAIRVKLGYRLYESNIGSSSDRATNEYSWYKTDKQALERLKNHQYISEIKPNHRCIKFYNRLEEENIIN